jgi:hypothetical protein
MPASHEFPPVPAMGALEPTDGAALELAPDEAAESFDGTLLVPIRGHRVRCRIGRLNLACEVAGYGGTVHEERVLVSNCACAPQHQI